MKNGRLLPPTWQPVLHRPFLHHHIKNQSHIQKPWNLWLLLWCLWRRTNLDNKIIQLCSTPLRPHCNKFSIQNNRIQEITHLPKTTNYVQRYCEAAREMEYWWQQFCNSTPSCTRYSVETIENQITDWHKAASNMTWFPILKVTGWPQPFSTGAMQTLKMPLMTSPKSCWGKQMALNLTPTPTNNHQCLHWYQIIEDYIWHCNE